jgi:SOS-response transcriptional repressor LexA
MEEILMSDRSAVEDLLGLILSRIDQRLEHEKLSARAACLRAGLSAGQIKTMRRQHRMKRQHGASVSTLTRLAAALNTTPEWLTSGVGPEERAPSNFPPVAGRHFALPLAGSVAAGVWTEVPSDKVDLQQSPVPPDPRYPPSWQCAYEVRGNSVDRIARPGDFLIVVDRTAAGLSARPGDIIIVTRKKQGLQEVTARRFQKNGTDCLLTFDSTDIRYNGVALPVRSLLPHSDQQETGIDVIGGIVIGVYRPLMISYMNDCRADHEVRSLAEPGQERRQYK